MARRQSSEASWGPAAGLLAGCLVTLAGVAMDLPPTTILLRSSISGCIVGAMTIVFSLGWQLITPQKDEE